MHTRKLISIWRATDVGLKSSKLRSAATKDTAAVLSSNQHSTKEDNCSVSQLVLDSGAASLSDVDSAKQTSRIITSVVADRASETRVTGDLNDEMTFGLPWFPTLKQGNASTNRRTIARDRKQKWMYKNTQNDRYDQVVLTCAARLGPVSTLNLFGKLGRDTSLKGYNTLIGVCLEKAKKLKNESEVKEQIGLTYNILQSMRNQGFPIVEAAYGPILTCLIDIHMIGGFNIIYDFVKDADASSVPRLSYYQMLLWIELGNEDAIQKIYDDMMNGDSEGGAIFHENYLLALCEKGRKKEVLQFLDIMDVTKMTSLDNVMSLFKSLGRLSVESFADEFIETLKTNDRWGECLSDFIYYYASNVTPLAVEITIQKFKHMHARLDVIPSSTSFERLIMFCCDSHKVYLALDLADEMLAAGLSVSTDVLNAISHACEQSCQYNLVQQIRLLIGCHNLKPNNETFRSMINLTVRMKDFDAAYTMVDYLQKLELLPSANIYNAILAGYFREKNTHGVSRVLEQMEHAGVKPDSQTFAYLISNSDCEEEIIKHYEELKKSGVHATKQVYMALINAYTACGLFEKAKLVLRDKGLPVKNMNEIKSSLVGALASQGQVLGAIEIYKEIKDIGACLEPKAVISLIEHTQSAGHLNTLLELLDELNDPDYWMDGCNRVISYCVANNHLRSVVELLKKLSDMWDENDLAMEFLFDEVFSKIPESDPPPLQIGLDLLKAIKEELKLQPSRKCLDFLLAACVNAKDLHSAHLIWKEYQILGLPYNVFTHLRMYQAFLAAGDFQAAGKLLHEIPKNDDHVRFVIEACVVTYRQNKQKKKKVKGLFFYL